MTYDKTQKAYFDESSHQYPIEKVIQPETHTFLETQLLISRINNPPPSIIMDFGSGSGRITFPLLQRGYIVHAIDVSQKSLNQLKKVAARFSSHLKTFTKIPREKYDVIVGSDILHHVDLNITLPVLKKSLASGGKIVFSEPGGGNLFWYLYLPIFHKWDIEKGVASCTFFNLKNLLIKFGFHNIKVTGLGLAPRFMFKWSPQLCSFNDKLGNLPILKLFAYRYLIEAESK